MWPHFWNAGDQWEIDWEQRPDGRPAKAEVAQALAAHHGASRYAGSIALSTEVGDVIRQARADLEPGAAVVLDAVIRADGCLSSGKGAQCRCGFPRGLPRMSVHGSACQAFSQGRQGVV